jgi:hypothetical protein
MRTLWKIVLSFLIWPISVMAQDPSPPDRPVVPIQSPFSENNSTPGSDEAMTQSPGPSPLLPVQTSTPLYFRPTNRPPIGPAYFPRFNVSAGYSITNLAMSSLGRVTLTGMDVSLSADSGRRIGAKLDLSYTLAPNVSGTGQRADEFSYLVGPTFSLWKGNRLSAYAQVLGGGARVTGPVPDGSGGFNKGNVHYPAWDFGGSAEYRLSSAFGFRVTVDYLHTHFFDSSVVVRGQNDIRIVSSIVYYFGQPIRFKHSR